MSYYLPLCLWKKSHTRGNTRTNVCTGAISLSLAPVREFLSVIVLISLVVSKPVEPRLLRVPSLSALCVSCISDKNLHAHKHLLKLSTQGNLVCFAQASFVYFLVVNRKFVCFHHPTVHAANTVTDRLVVESFPW